jgi:hypothetical protein
MLADKSIAEGDRAAFNELEGLSKNEQEFALKIAAHAELRRVISFWSLMSTTEHASISVTLKDGTLKEDKEIPTPNLIAALFHNRDWRARAVAARLLNNRPENGVPNHLLSCARNDTHLEVVKHALQSFKSITGSDVKGVFNVDGLERWWKEHSAEVSERLTEMK